jgi:phosphoglucomutase
VTISPLAGKTAPKDDPSQLVSFGTSEHRGSPFSGSFTETHILAITQAIFDYRRDHRMGGPLSLGKDTHAVSGPAQRTALEVLTANDVKTIIQRDDGVAPTPALSRSGNRLNFVYRDQTLLDAIVSGVEEIVGNALRSTR